MHLQLQLKYPGWPISSRLHIVRVCTWQHMLEMRSRRSRSIRTHFHLDLTRRRFLVFPLPRRPPPRAFKTRIGTYETPLVYENMRSSKKSPKAINVVRVFKTRPLSKPGGASSSLPAVPAHKVAHSCLFASKRCLKTSLKTCLKTDPS